MRVPPIIDTLFVYFTAASLVAVALEMISRLFPRIATTSSLREPSTFMRRLLNATRVVAIMVAIFGPLSLLSEGRITDLLWPLLIVVCLYLPVYALSIWYWRRTEKRRELQKQTAS
jgi:hypothetical protein